ncbi:MAG: hypothetical protein DIJKHBIC_04044 [Thermoanaerobaculia bacterium]|nr:hypothetical protein [Thermoanaerobaculia bacterium]
MSSLAPYLSHPVAMMAAIVLGILVVASTVYGVLLVVRKDKDWSELRARIGAWWIMASLFFGVLLGGNKALIVFFALISFWALKEFITLLPTRPADHGALVLAFLSIPIQYYWIWTGWYGMFIIFIPVYMFLALPIRLVLSGETSGFVASASQLQWGLMAFVFGLSHLCYLSTFPDFAGTKADGRTVVLFLVFVVEISDVLQYIWGKTLGRHKVIPLVSPNKTWEGLVGGVISASALSLVIRFLTPFALWECVAVALLITVVGFFGGAVMSAVKRDYGVKDFSSLIPGHGGVLDRLDSLCWAAPVFLHYIRYFHIPKT